MNWIREMEKAFRSSECGENQKATFGSQMFKEAALTWWNVNSSSVEATILANLSWSTFKKKLMEEFCNERALNRMEEEFRSLKKENLSLKEYNCQFMDKLGLVGHLVPTEKEKITAYTKGLPTEMKNLVRVSKASTLHGAIEEAQLVEDSYGPRKIERSGSIEKRRWEGNSAPSKRIKPFNNNYRGNESGHDRRDCPVRGITCFECKESGHIRSECPRLNTGGNGVKKTDPPRATGRAFQMTTKEAKASTDVVSEVPTSTLEDALVVDLEDGDQVVIRDIIRGCKLEIEEKEFLVDVMPMVIGGFGAVIGMDLLANNRAEILCAKKLIRIPILNDESVTVYGERRKGKMAIISLVKAQKCLSKGCSSFLAYVIDGKLEKKNLEDVEVVKEFPDVFPDDLPGLPPDRQV
ncbi:hypothetical protein L6452_20481 [Arctium lappa]|uniref:Uncharacterized protein n=1 Tax=Arctium lappa TaxID=4217 RepID=A0ACB9BAM8_ARCLA|nr:hypothetical protein L6452_20481 [Arctium lappa]